MTQPGETMSTISVANKPFLIRTVTAFVALEPLDFGDSTGEDGTTNAAGEDCAIRATLADKISNCSTLLREVESQLKKTGYEVQTVRIATNPFGEWLTAKVAPTEADNRDHGHHGGRATNSGQTEEDPVKKKNKLGITGEGKEIEVDKSTIMDRLQKLNNLLSEHNIGFCSLGPSMNPRHTTSICPLIVSVSPGRFSCSANVEACDVEAARSAAKCIRIISSLGNDVDNSGSENMGDKNHLTGGLGNFRFCTASCVPSGVPFFPAARGPSLSFQKSHSSHPIRFGIGLENGEFARQLCKQAKSISEINIVFFQRMRKELLPIQEICLGAVCDNLADKFPIEYLGIDTSFNPSLDNTGSVASAIETLDEVRGDFGQCGSLAAAAAITTSLQNVPDILKTGYCGLMLPVLEDKRLAELGMTQTGNAANSPQLTIQKLLYISSVCGVGIDTVPIPGNVSEDSLSSLILDVAALAGRWKKPLSCRVFPVPGGNAGEKTTFDSPYMCNSCIFDCDDGITRSYVVSKE